MNDFRVARNDDETFTDEDTFVSERRDALVNERRKMAEYVRDALDDAMMADGEDYFATKLAEFFIAADKHNDDWHMASAAGTLWAALAPLIMERLRRDAETDAQAEWDNRQTGAPE